MIALKMEEIGLHGFNRKVECRGVIIQKTGVMASAANPVANKTHADFAKRMIGRASVVVSSSNLSAMPDLSDPFQEARAKDGVLQCPFNGENTAMILRNEDIRCPRAIGRWGC